MARVTVEDCIDVINNRYELVLLAAQRARDIAAGAGITVDRDNDKNTVVSLREGQVTLLASCRTSRTNLAGFIAIILNNHLQARRAVEHKILK